MIAIECEGKVVVMSDKVAAGLAVALADQVRLRQDHPDLTMTIGVLGVGGPPPGFQIVTRDEYRADGFLKRFRERNGGV